MAEKQTWEERVKDVVLEVVSWFAPRDALRWKDVKNDVPDLAAILSDLKALEQRAEEAEAKYDSEYGRACALEWLVKDLGKGMEEAEAEVKRLREALEGVLTNPRWMSIGSTDNTAEIRVSRSRWHVLMSMAREGDAFVVEAQANERAVEGEG